MNEWQTKSPPNEVLVEAINEKTGEIQRVTAFWGRDGYRPHWRGENGIHYSVAYFIQWRYIDELRPDNQAGEAGK